MMVKREIDLSEKVQLANHKCEPPKLEINKTLLRVKGQVNVTF